MKKNILVLFNTLLTIVILSTTLKTDIIRKDIDMEHITFNDIKLKKSGIDSIFSMNICNKYIENYYFYKLFIPKSNKGIIWGFKIYQEGKRVRYKGRYAKIKMEKFPDGYIAIEPNKCLPISVKLNQYFDFDQDKEITLTYSKGLRCPDISEKNINIHFTKTLSVE